MSHPKEQETKHDLKQPTQKLTEQQFVYRQHVAGWFAAIALSLSLGLSFFGWGQKVGSSGVKTLQVFVLVAWTLGPPIWFWYEYIFLFRDVYPNQDKDKLESLKTQQDLSSKIWIAAASVLLILYFWKDIGAGK